MTCYPSKIGANKAPFFFAIFTALVMQKEGGNSYVQNSQEEVFRSHSRRDPWMVAWSWSSNSVGRVDQP